METSQKIRKIKTAILVDIMGSGFGDTTPEMEIKAHRKRFSKLVKPHSLTTYRAYGAGDIHESTELVIYDYGGMGPGNSLMEDNARDIVKWAEEHPNGLVVVVSGFTYRHFLRFELEDRGLTLPNIVVDDLTLTASGEDRPKEDWYKDISPIPEWFLV